MIKNVKAKELDLGDEVSTFPGDPSDHSFSAAVVTKKEAEGVTLFRPYAITSDFEYTGGVIPYIGFEEYRVSGDSDVRLLRKSGPKH